MDRARASLTVVVGLVVLFGAACTTSGSPVGSGSNTTVPTTTSSRVNPSAAGYPLPKGRQVSVTQGQTGRVTLTVGDILAVHRPAGGTRPGGEALVLAEFTDTQLIYQAVAAGKATVATDDPPPPPICKTTPCPPGRAAPPVVDVDVTG
jgi:hypothetical protein